MKAFYVSRDYVSDGIPVSMSPYPRIVLGDGGHKQATWIALGRRDQENIIKRDDNDKEVVFDVGILKVKDKEQFLIVAPRPGEDNRALVFWAVSSGYRGSSSIKTADDVLVVGYDHSWHSGRGNLGSTAEILAVLKPGQKLEASKSGRRVQQDRARLTWDGKEIKVEFFESGSDPDTEQEGELI